ncbi:major facilitator superfamily domain-containing protein [Xylariaceae sp. FL0016]|nr:major facilitator superfamily domain-containing protein [Xylariaceae sp. FL0016]
MNATGDDREKAMGTSLAPSISRDNEPSTTEPANMKTASEPEPFGATKLAFMLGALTLASFLVFLDSSIVSTAIPKITDEFHSLTDVGWYGSAYHAALVPLSGGIYYCFRLQWSYLVYFALFEIGSAICGAAQSSSMLIVGRAIAGIGGSGLSSGAFIIVAATVSMERRPFIVGILFGISQIGAVLGPLIGGAFTTGYTWRWCFYINLPLGALVALPLIIMRVPEQVPKKNPFIILRELHLHLDLIGFALLTPAIVMLLLALQYGGVDYSWSSSQIIGLFCGAGVTFIVWCLWNHHKGEKGLLPFPILKRRAVYMSGINYTFLIATMYGGLYFLPIYFQAVKGVNAILSGVYLLPLILPQIAAAVISGSIVQKIGYVIPMALFGTILNTIGSGLFSTFQPGTTTGQWVGYSIISGVGRGSSLQMPMIAVQAAASPKEMSSAMAFIVWCQYLGPAVFLALFNLLFDASLVQQLHKLLPQVDAQDIIDAGATGFRDLVSPQDLPSALKAYSNSLDRTFYLQAGASVVACFAALGMGWIDIRKKASQPTSKPETKSNGAPPSNGSQTTAQQDGKAV